MTVVQEGKHYLFKINIENFEFVNNPHIKFCVQFDYLTKQWNFIVFETLQITGMHTQVE